MQLLPPHAAFNWIHQGSALIFDVPNEGSFEDTEMRGADEPEWLLQERGLAPYGYLTLLGDLSDAAKGSAFDALVDNFFGPSEVPELAIVFSTQPEHLAEASRGRAMAQWMLQNRARPHSVFLVDRDRYAQKYEHLQHCSARDAMLAFPSEIVDDTLYLGPLATATSAAVLGGLRITHVISVLDLPVHLPCDTKVEHLRLHIADSPDADLPAVLREALPWMAAAFGKAGARVLVHCAQGRSRSASVVIAWLACVRRALELHGAGGAESTDPTASLQAATKLVKELRPCVQPNCGFATALEWTFQGDAFAPLTPALQPLLETDPNPWRLALAPGS